MSMNDPGTPRDPYTRGPRAGGFGLAWLWVLIIIVVIGIGWGWHGGWWGSGGSNRAANPPAQTTTGQGTASRPANPAPNAPAQSNK